MNTFPALADYLRRALTPEERAEFHDALAAVHAGRSAVVAVHLSRAQAGSA